MNSKSHSMIFPKNKFSLSFIISIIIFFLHIQASVSFSLSMMANNNNNKMNVRFVTNKMCPFAQKAWIALEVCQVKYQLEQVSLYGPGGKPDWFWKLNPKGQVPVLVVDNNNDNDKNNVIILPDSDLILDSIDDVLSEGSILTVASDESKQRIADFRKVLSEFLPIGKQTVLGSSGNEQQEEKMWLKLRQLDALIVGPYVCGNDISIADCAAFPFLWRIQTEFGKKCFASHQCPNIEIWLQTCQNEKAFSTTIQNSWWWWW